MRRPSLALGLCLAQFGCASWVHPSASCSGEIAEPSEVDPGTLHVRVLLTHQGREQRHEVALEAHGESISGVGLTPMGTVAYRLRDDADGPAVDTGVGRYLGLDGARAYDAIARALLVPAERREGGEAHEVPWAGVVVIERPECGYRAEVHVVSDERRRVSDAPPRR